MKIWLILVLTAAALLVIWFENRGIAETNNKERRAVIALTALGWLLSVFLVLVPDAPGPNVWVEAFYKPLGNWLRSYAESIY